MRRLIIYQRAISWWKKVAVFRSLFLERTLWSLFQNSSLAILVPVKISEGFKKRRRTDEARYMNIAHASLD